MSLKKTLSDWFIAQIRSQNPDISDTRVAELEYGFLALYLTATKFAIILLLAWWLKLLPEMLTVMATFAAVRTWAGGVHAESSLACLITTSIIYFGVAVAANYFLIPTYLLLFMALIALVLFYYYAPADHANKPIRSEKHRSKLKQRTLLFSIFCIILSFLIPIGLRDAIILSVFVESLMITPIAYKITNNRGGEYYEEAIR